MQNTSFLIEGMLEKVETDSTEILKELGQGNSAQRGTIGVLHPVRLRHSLPEKNPKHTQKKHPTTNNVLTVCASYLHQQIFSGGLPFRQVGNLHE